MKNKAAVFILLGQSNAVGHGVPMAEEDKIKKPLKNVFGLHRKDNQSFDIKSLTWTGYQSGGMNLGETQDDTYSVANCLAKQWQSAVDTGEDLPDLYIVQIAIGAQGVTETYMWYPEREKKLIPGKLGEADISLYPLTCHILSLLEESFAKMGKEPDYIGIHWRGGENDVTESMEKLQQELKSIYNTLFNGFCSAIGKTVPIILHHFVSEDRCMDMDPTGMFLQNLRYINRLFEEMAAETENLSLFDIRKAPFYVPNVRGNGIYIKDVVHYTPEANAWVASEILREYKEQQ